MPNWVENDLYVIGSVKHRRAVEQALVGEGGEAVDFNRVVPMPSSFLLSPSGAANPKEGSDPFSWEWVRELGLSTIDDIENHIAEKLYSIGVPKHQDLDISSFSRRHPRRSEIVDWCQCMGVVLPIKYGHPSWCEWSEQNWGAKWNASQSAIVQRRHVLKFKFNTPWRAPTRVVVALAKAHPQVTIVMQSFEALMQWQQTLFVQFGKVVAEEHQEYTGPRGG
jgi:hypothetical protein